MTEQPTNPDAGATGGQQVPPSTPPGGPQDGQQYGPQYGQQYGAPQYGPKRLTRTADDRMIAGVCGGLARYLNVDPTLVRVAAVVCFFFGFPAVLLGYLVAWAIVPKA